MQNLNCERSVLSQSLQDHEPQHQSSKWVLNQTITGTEPESEFEVGVKERAFMGLIGS